MLVRTIYLRDTDSSFETLGEHGPGIKLIDNELQIKTRNHFVSIFSVSYDNTTSPRYR